MKILISGSTGLIGSALVVRLRRENHEVSRLVRSPSRVESGDVLWNPALREIDQGELSNLDAVVHLAGENIFGRWTVAKKQRIRNSRIHGTRLLSESLAVQEKPPCVLICASAVGYYGDRGAEILTEDSGPGAGFLADVCREWESAAVPAQAAGIRVAYLRTGMVLTRDGGALARMLPAFRLGVGGILGDGRQYMSWVAMDDAIEVILHTLTNDRISGPVNLTAPDPVTNREFTKTLGRALRRPTLFPVPAFAVRLAFGEMADEVILASARVQSARLTAEGYSFRYGKLTDALRHILVS